MNHDGSDDVNDDNDDDDNNEVRDDDLGLGTVWQVGLAQQEWSVCAIESSEVCAIEKCEPARSTSSSSGTPKTGSHPWCVQSCSRSKASGTN